MSRPSIIVIDQDAERRMAISRGLAELNFEVVPVADKRDGVRYAKALDPWVIVASTAVLDPIPEANDSGPNGDSSQAALLNLGQRASLLLIGEASEGDDSLPDDVLYLAIDPLASNDLVYRVRMVILGRDLRLVPDLQLRHLLGDLEERPFFELIPTLQQAKVTGRLELFGGTVFLERGEVIAARQGRAQGLKAFCRLAIRSEGPFRLVVGPHGAERELDHDIDTLMMHAVEDSLGDMPEPTMHLELKLADDKLETALEPLARQLLAAIRQGHKTVGDLLEALPARDSEIVHQLLDLEQLAAIGFIDPKPPLTVVTDSACDLPPKLAAAHHIHVVPLTITFGPRSFIDGVELSPQQFYDQLASSAHSPSTSPPSSAVFADTYTGLWPRQNIVSVHLSGKLSQTLEHARAAATTVRQRISVDRSSQELDLRDSGQVSVALGLQALFAARMAARGLTATEIGERLAKLASRLHLLFVVDTLDYLVKGGRIGRARGLIGKWLGIKPILGIEDGEVVAIDRARGGRKAQRRLIERFQERLDTHQPVICGIGHAQAPVWGDALRRKIESSFNVEEMIVTQIGPVVGTHAGPGTVGAALCQPAAEDLPWIAPVSTV